MIEPMNGEVTFDNNSAQENFGEFEAEGSSPYKAVEFDATARNPYDQPIVMDLLARQVPKDWSVALDHGAVWLPPKGEKKVHVVTWTDRVPEWETSDKGQTNQGPRKAMISVEGWTIRPEERYFPVGGITEMIQAVRHVNISLNSRQKDVDSGSKLSVFGQVSPSAGVAPISIQYKGPGGKIESERTNTDPNGAFTHVFQSGLTNAGLYRIQAFALPGSANGQADSNILTVQVH
jgi:hypothetical protein